MKHSSLRIGIDIGGTFTDFVVYDPASGQLQTFKLLSTPSDPAEAVLNGLASILEQAKYSGEKSRAQPATIIHGSTVATNALLERKGAPTALITTRGFRDILQIGRQNRPLLYDLFADPLPALVPSELRFEVNERIDHEGKIIQPLETSGLDQILKELKTRKVTSVAVCLLFSFLHPEHEQRIGEKLRQAGFLVSLSSEISPEYREYERTSTTVVNAFVAPVLDKYLTHLEKNLNRFVVRDGAEMKLLVMQSNGGSISPAEARREAVRCILSGPAGGVVGCEYIGRNARLGQHPTDTKKSGINSQDPVVKLITFDMGGTSTDVSLIDGKAHITTEAVVSGCPIRIPLLDIHTIGAGGGSIARVDKGGALRVGPESAGADPGPACYGREEHGLLPAATVTDANVVLGRIQPGHFLGGQMPLAFDRAYAALERLGHELNMSAEEAARGVVAVTNAHMERALRVISVERGHDPRSFTLLSFGGAGGLHAADLARGLGIPRVLIPPLASTLSAFGMLAANIVKDDVLTVMLPGNTPIAKLAALLEPMVERSRQEVLAERIPEDKIHIERYLDMRYQGQSYELTVPFSNSILDEFHRMHERQYGYAKNNALIEIVNLRVQVVGEVTPPPLVAEQPGDLDPTTAFLEKRDVLFAQKIPNTPLYQAERLKPGNQVSGPAVIVRSDTTILVGPSDQANVDAFCNLIIEVGA